MGKIFNASNNMVVGLHRKEIEDLCNKIIDLEIPQLDYEDRELGFEIITITDEMDRPYIGSDFLFNAYKKGKWFYQIDIEVPCAYKNEDCFAENLYFYLLDMYNFDMYEYGEKIGTTFEETNILFSIVHELSHMKHCITELNKYGEFVTEMSDKKERFNICMDTSKDSFNKYRMLPTERYADENAIYLLEKYEGLFREAMKQIVYYFYF